MKLVFVIFLLIVACFHSIQCTHLKGTFTSNDFFKFLIKFGFQKTDRHQRESTHGYIFGNITSRHNVSHQVTFAVLDRSYFLNYYQSRLIDDKSLACQRMFNKLKTKAFHPKCSSKGQDYLRRVPCTKGVLCKDEDTPWNVVKNHQFTYVIQDLVQPLYKILFF